MNKFNQLVNNIITETKYKFTDTKGMGKAVKKFADKLSFGKSFVKQQNPKYYTSDDTGAKKDDIVKELKKTCSKIGDNGVDMYYCEFGSDLFLVDITDYPEMTIEWMADSSETDDYI